MSFSALSNGLADAVASVSSSLLGLRGPRRAGTAFSVGGGRVVTAAHLVHGDSRTVPAGSRDSGPLLLADGSSVQARLVGAAPALDLALLAIDAELPAVPWGDALRVGNLVVPVGFGPRATLGVVARLGGAWQTPAGAPVDRWIEVDGSLPAGFSGGPLLSADGVVGMNTHRLVRGGTTLPVQTLRTAIDALEKRGTIDPGFLGIGGATASLSGPQAAAAGQDEALLVVAVESGSPAEGVLAVGDIVLRVDGQTIRGPRTLRGVLAGLGSGHTAQLDVLSGTTVDTRSVTLVSRPEGVE
ncbi:MAG: S1C family serine protease [Myxococcota bacterium]